MNQNSPKITLIVAAAENNVIGKNNQLIWHLPNDLKFFRRMTTNNSVVMGRKTFESMNKALPNRRNIVLTRDQDWNAEDVDVMQKIEDIFSYCRDEREVFVIGGGEIYRQALTLANKILLTRVHTKLDGDTYFPELDFSNWELTESEKHSKDEKHAYDYTFETWERK